MTSLILYGIILNIAWVFARIDFYKGERQTSYDCDVDITEPFSCICLHSGLWKIYSSCLEFSYVAVKLKHCFSPREMIRRVELVAQSTATLSRVNINHRTEFTPQVTLQLLDDDQLVTNRALRISDGIISICLTKRQSQVNDHYCLFKVNDLRVVTIVSETCRDGDSLVFPEECHRAVEDALTCPPSFEPHTPPLPTLIRNRRMLPPFPIEKNPIADNKDPDDEDFWDPTSPNPYGPDVPNDGSIGKSVESPIIVAEVWNYLDQQLDEVLGLGNPHTPPASMQEIPVFKILDASKNVMLKTCPPYYVRPEFFDLAVDTFTAVLMKRNYLKEFNTEFVGLNRILQALSKCQQNATAFPFIDESSHDECDSGHKKTNPGAYEKWDNRTELTVHETMESYEYDAIIDVVWKIFINAYQQCFVWFDPGNSDVFRYATIMEALFQGEIHDLWIAGKTQGRMFGGFLGNIKEITEYVTYCAASTALETTFPWSVNRPGKMTESSPPRIRRYVKNFRIPNAQENELDEAARCSLHSQCVDFIQAKYML